MKNANRNSEGETTLKVQQLDEPRNGASCVFMTEMFENFHSYDGQMFPFHGVKCTSRKSGEILFREIYENHFPFFFFLPWVCLQSRLFKAAGCFKRGESETTLLDDQTSLASASLAELLACNSQLKWTPKLDCLTAGLRIWQTRSNLLHLKCTCTCT